jgi:hypothetical protein
MTLMPPGEHLDGTTAERAHLRLLLVFVRETPATVEAVRSQAT